MDDHVSQSPQVESSSASAEPAEVTKGDTTEEEQQPPKPAEADNQEESEKMPAEESQREAQPGKKVHINIDLFFLMYN